jgi:hypothetical protein
MLLELAVDRPHEIDKQHPRIPAHGPALALHKLAPQIQIRLGKLWRAGGGAGLGACQRGRLARQRGRDERLPVRQRGLQFKCACARLEGERKRVRVHFFKVFRVRDEFLAERGELGLHAFERVDSAAGEVSILQSRKIWDSLWTDRFPPLDPLVPRPLAEVLAPEVRREAKHDEVLHGISARFPTAILSSPRRHRGTHILRIDPQITAQLHRPIDRDQPRRGIYPSGQPLHISNHGSRGLTLVLVIHCADLFIVRCGALGGGRVRLGRGVGVKVVDGLRGEGPVSARVGIGLRASKAEPRDGSGR